MTAIFYRLHLIEAYGTGIGKIMKSYGHMEQKPVIESTKNAFKATLPNINTIHGNANGPMLQSDINSIGKPDDNAAKILDYGQSHGYVTRNDITGLLDVSPSTATQEHQYGVK